MRVAIICNDTRGGVVPYVALARGLRDAGHAVRAVAPGDLAPLFADAGIAVAALSGDVQRTVRESGVAEMGALARLRFMARELPVRLSIWARETLAACEGSELMTGGIGGMVVGLGVAERLGIPFVPAHLQPVAAPTGRYPGALLSGVPAWLGAGALTASHWVSDQALWMPFRGAMRAVRRDTLGLSGRARPAAPTTLYGFSRHVVPLPDRPRHARHVTGYWRESATREPPDAALAAFVARPGPVVSIGFGSMASDDPAAMTALVTGAVRDAGARAVLLSGWGGLGGARSDDVFTVEAAPHDWLFARMAANVHHGGAGTTGAGLAAGQPSLAVPFAVDQPFWGRRIAALGAGPPPIGRQRVSRARLAAALRTMLADAAMQDRARDLGARIRAEDGVAAAVRVFATLEGTAPAR